MHGDIEPMKLQHFYLNYAVLSLLLLVWFYLFPTICHYLSCCSQENEHEFCYNYYHLDHKTMLGMYLIGSHVENFQ